MKRNKLQVYLPIFFILLMTTGNTLAHLFHHHHDDCSSKEDTEISIHHADHSTLSSNTDDHCPFCLYDQFQEDGIISNQSYTFSTLRYDSKFHNALFSEPITFSFFHKGRGPPSTFSLS